MNWHQIWEVASAPDNVPIVALLFLVPFYVWYAFRQALDNDRLIDKLSADPGSRQDRIPQDRTVESEVGTGSSHLAVPDAHRTWSPPFWSPRC